jgi:thymidylate kinase
VLRWTVSETRCHPGACGARAGGPPARNDEEAARRAEAWAKHGFTVALIGPDGAGKTTIARRLESSLDVSVKYLYMGVNPDASNHLLPTTRLAHALKRRRGAPPDTAGPPESRRAAKPPPRGLRRVRSTSRSLLRVANRLAEEWHRQLVASHHLRRGAIVVFDRHFFADYYVYDVVRNGNRSLARRIHGFALRRFYPRPDLVVYLDAPPEALLARKGEGTLESLARRRREYLELARVLKQFHVVDASRPLDEVTRDVVGLIDNFHERKAHEARAGS